MMIGRGKELKRLLDAAQEEESRFVAVYGRRRVGKTYLVRETFSGQFAFEHTGSASGTMGDQQAFEEHLCVRRIVICGNCFQNGNCSSRGAAAIDFVVAQEGRRRWRK